MERTFELMLVEDDPADVLMFREVLEDSGLPARLSVAEDGQQAVSFLEQGLAHAPPRAPDLVFLDLNLPRKDGREVLQEIRARQELSSVPVVILTTSEAEADVRQGYRLGANSYMTKPVGLKEYRQSLRAALEYWLRIAEVPRGFCPEK